MLFNFHALDLSMFLDTCQIVKSFYTKQEFKERH